MVAGALVIVGLGSVALSDTEGELSGERAEKSLTQFDSKAGLVALGESDSQRVTFPTDEDGQLYVEDSAGWMNITIENRTTGDVSEVMNVTLGSVRYEGEQRELAYQGGGVWQASETGGQMISPPEFHYRNGTLTLPTVKLAGESSLATTVDVTQAGERQVFPNATKNDDEWINPLDNHKVNLTVGSEFYEGWGDYFEERTDGDVIYERDRERVTLELVVPADNPPVEGGLVTGTTEELIVKNNAQLDSYNSANGNYSATSGSNTRILGSGDLSVRQNSEVYGNIEVDGDVTVEKNAVLRDGNISYGGTIGGGGWDDSWSREDKHWVNDNGSVRSPDAVDLLINERIDDIEDENDNTGTVADGGTLNCGGDCTLTAGEYYFDNLTVGGSETLELNTSGGVIEIAVDGNITFENDAIANVTGDNRVNIWADADATFSNGAEVREVADNSTKFWLYMNPERQATLRQNAKVTGVIYGPGNLEPGVDIILNQNALVFGGAIGDVDFASNNIWIHYDEELAETESVTHETSVVRITYLHVSVNEIAVGSP